LKKSGFFHQALDVLSDLEKQTLAHIEEHKNVSFQKKVLFKVYRDYARLYCLKRDFKQAQAKHLKAEEIMHQDVYPGIHSNIKLAKLTLLKGVWMGKLDIEKANEELTVAYHMFDELFAEK
jgi:hypothetical protein